jgi:hypothetical protein
MLTQERFFPMEEVHPFCEEEAYPVRLKQEEVYEELNQGEVEGYHPMDYGRAARLLQGLQWVRSLLDWMTQFYLAYPIGLEEEQQSVE